MPNLNATAALTRDPDFRDRVTAAAIQAAVNISGEARDAARPNYATARQAFAQAVLNNPLSYAERFAWAVATNGAIAASYAANGDSTTIPDGDIEFTISTVWDDLSGAATAVEPPADAP